MSASAEWDVDESFFEDDEGENEWITGKAMMNPLVMKCKLWV